MSLFNVLNLIGGLCLFLFGMSLMGQALERRAGNKLKSILSRLTSGKFAGVLTGLVVTAIIQSSSATTVMVVGFVNSGLMTLQQSINVIMGANIGTTVTAWILSLAGIDGKNVFVTLLKPSSFTPILAFIGLLLYMVSKQSKRKDTGMILLGFATLMYGMETMSGAVSILRNVPSFQQLFLLFSNPLLGVLAGAVLTAIIQSSSASVGILQALAVTGAVSYGAAVPIIMGQNIGTCATALISSLGANKNARRAAFVHLSFNVIGSAVWLAVFCIVKSLYAPEILSQPASLLGIAVTHSIFNVLCTLLLLPFGGLLEKLVCFIIPDADIPEKAKELDERLLVSPALALNQSKKVLEHMGERALFALKESLECVLHYDLAKADRVREAEDETDHLEDILGTYLVKLTSRQLGDEESVRATEYMRIIGEYERIGDHAVNILESAEELNQKHIVFSKEAAREYLNMCAALSEILNLSYEAFCKDDYEAAKKAESLEQVIDAITEELRTRHILRLQKGFCSVVAGFVWSDLLTNIERVSDHCSNISGCVLDTAESNMNIHENQRLFRNYDDHFSREYREYKKKYAL